MTYKKSLGYILMTSVAGLTALLTAKAMASKRSAPEEEWVLENTKSKTFKGDVPIPAIVLDSEYQIDPALMSRLNENKRMILIGIKSILPVEDMKLICDLLTQFKVKKNKLDAGKISNHFVYKLDQIFFVQKASGLSPELRALIVKSIKAYHLNQRGADDELRLGLSNLTTLKKPEKTKVLEQNSIVDRSSTYPIQLAWTNYGLQVVHQELPNPQSQQQQHSSIIDLANSDDELTIGPLKEEELWAIDAILNMNR